MIPVIVFSVLLLLPFGWQAVSDLRGEKRFQPFDIFKDVVYTPFVREQKTVALTDSLKTRWQAAREAIAAGTEASEAIEPVVSSLSDLQTSVFTVNTYAELDSNDYRYKSLKHADSLLASLEDEPENFKATDSTLKAIIEDLGQFSLWRAFKDVKHYGIWSGRYLRAFENKIDDESAIVQALRPMYQLAVWKVFSDPGEKVVLGADGKCVGKSCGREETKPEDKWLFYRQDVDFLVQPHPLDKRSVGKIDDPIAAIQKFRDQLKKKGVELLVVITPGKPSIYTEKLTGQASDAAENAGVAGNAAGLQSHGKKILDSLTRAGFNTVDLYTPLLAAKSRDSVEGPLYLNDDTHWTPRGAELAAAEIAAAVNRLESDGKIKLKALSECDDCKPPFSFIAKDSVANRMGDVGEMSGLNKFGVFKMQKVTGHVVSQLNIMREIESNPDFDAAVDSVWKMCNEKFKDKAKIDSCYNYHWKEQEELCEKSGAKICAQQWTLNSTESVFKDDFRNSEILILGDSFSRIYQTDSPVNAGWIAHFAKNVNRPVASIVSDGGASTLVREKLARKASVLKGKKLLIWEFVERDLRFGAEGWKTVEF